MNVNYKKKYQKYKIKYLSLKGGKIPVYNPLNEQINISHILPIAEAVSFDTTRFVYHNIPLDDTIKFIDIFKYHNKIIEINEDNKIPFHALFLQFNFNIIENFKNLCGLSNLSGAQHKSVNNKFMEHFVFTKEGRYIGISAKPNQLTKYIYINKFIEYLKIIYNTRLNIREQILELYDNNIQKIIDLHDMFDVYSDYTNNDLKIDEYKEIISQDRDKNNFEDIISKEIDFIKSFRKFVVYIDSIVLGLEINIKPSLLFFACYISERIKNNCLTIGCIGSNLFGISLKNLLLNLFNNNLTIPEQNREILILYNYMLLPNIYNYGSSHFNGNSYPDCVENGLLHMLKCLIYNTHTQDYDIELLKTIQHKIDGRKFTIYQTIKPEIYQLLRDITLKNENSQELKDGFSLLVSNIPEGIVKKIYKNQNYEILSTQENFDFILTYLLGVINIENIKSDNIKIKKNDKAYNILYKNDIVSSYITITVLSGHTAVGYNTKYRRYLPTYIYKDLIMTLTDKYFIHDNVDFDFELEFNKYIGDASRKLPLYLKFMLLNSNLYFFASENIRLDLVNILIKNPQFFSFFSRIANNFNETEICSFILKSNLIRFIYNKIIYITSSSKIIEFINKFKSFLIEYKNVIIKETNYKFINDEYKINKNIDGIDYTIKDFAIDLIRTEEFVSLNNKDQIIETIFRI